MLREPIKLTLGHKPKWAKEGEDAWVLRLLGLKQTSGLTLWLHALEDEVAGVGSCEISLREIPLAPARAVALRAWIRIKETGAGEEPHATSLIAIIDPDRSALLCQRKDEMHPNPACRGLLSLFSGGRQVGESPYETALRELYEEIRHVLTVDLIAERLIPVGAVTLTSQHSDQLVTFNKAVVRASSQVQFAAWAQAILAPEGVSEAQAVLLEGEELMAVLRQELAQPGSLFIEHHALFLDDIFRR